MMRIMERIVSGEGTTGDLDNMVDIADMIGGYTICPLGDAASLPVKSFIPKFRSEFEAVVKPGPATVSADSNMIEETTAEA